jgi:transcription elongation GreA/GreB family factor
MSTESESVQERQKLLALCHRFIDDRINTIQTAISAAQESANDETKSSAGDKYETGRAMMQIEIEQNAKQLAEAARQKSILNQINPSLVSDTVQPGSIITTDNGNFFIAVSVGQVQLEGKSFMVVSAQSPVGSKLMGNKVGAIVSFANKRYTIHRVG